MVKKVLMGVAFLALALIGVAGFAVVAYRVADARYQKDMDVVRQKDAQEIFALVQEYANKTGHLPFQDIAADKPLMVIIGHSDQEEYFFAEDPVLKRDANYSRSVHLDEMLSKELNRKIVLPRDPQKVPTYAPNVYVYFVAGNEVAVASHLHSPHAEAVEYKWQGGKFYSYTIAAKYEGKK